MTDNINRDVNINLKFRRDGDAEAIGAFERLQRRIDMDRVAAERLQKSLIELRRKDQVNELAAKYANLGQVLNNSEIAAEQLARELSRIGATGTEISEIGRAHV